MSNKFCNQESFGYKLFMFGTNNVAERFDEMVDEQ